RGLSTCELINAAWSVSLGACYLSCRFCNIQLPGLCQVGDLSFYNGLKSCLPTPTCTIDTLNFVLNFMRHESPGSGCNFSCLTEEPNKHWTMKVKGIRDTCISTTIREAQTESSLFSVYPNPSQGSFTMQSSSLNHDAKMEIYNMLGE